MNQKALYYQYPYIKEFSATVRSCAAVTDPALLSQFPAQSALWQLTLSAEGFYPEGGGQPGDRGIISEEKPQDAQGNAGGVHVLDTREGQDGAILYTDGPLPLGTAVYCIPDWTWRMRNSQNHSGEHIISGLVHRDYGYDNVGFHMHMEGEQPLITIDFNGPIDWENLQRIEREANAVVRQDLPIEVFYPTAEELEKLDYRSKKALSGPVRLVRIPGTDLCACCGTHVERTGEIGCIKLLSAASHRGGVRIEMLCGLDAFRDYERKHETVLQVSRRLSVKPEETAAAVEQLLLENQRQRQRIAELNERAFQQKAAEYARLFGTGEAAAEPQEAPETADVLTEKGVICDFERDMSPVELRRCCDYLMKHTGARLAAVFGRGEAEGAYSYVLGSRTEDVRPVGKTLNARLSGRGGGQAAMVQGSLRGSEAEIRSALAEAFS